MMSAMIQSPSTAWQFQPFGRMSSVEELDSNLTLLSRHAVLNRGMAMTPPGTPSVSRSPEQPADRRLDGSGPSKFDYGPESPAQQIPPNTPVTPVMHGIQRRCFGSATSNAPQPNVVAIDNKIEQAMDLVKTHLTFAVREEVEVLRQTITDLEMKVACLESENQLLRQYAPKEVVGNLAAMVQQQRASVPPPSAPQALPPPKVPAGFCSSTFASTLNSVVADVCHEMQQAKTRQQNTPGGEQ